MLEQFKTVDWASKAILYELNIRQFSVEGNFQSAEKALAKIQSIGVNTIWLMPITPISKEKRLEDLGSYYACSSYTGINPEFGSLTDFQQFVNTAHALGLKVIIDWVANHTGWDHHWTTEHPDWYQKDAQGNFTEKNGWTDVIDLDFANQDMRKAMMQAMDFWVETCNIDGFRCDMAHLVPLDFWKEARTFTEKRKPLFWLAECEETNYHDVFDVSYAWWWMHQTEKYAKGEIALNEIRNVLHAYSQYPAGARKLFYTSNHDENSWNGTEYEKYGIAAKAWAVFSATWQAAVPLVYNGQEAANDKRLAFFRKDLINWQKEGELDAFYSALFTLRTNQPAITMGETFILPTSNDHSILAYFRKEASKVVLVLLNVSKQDKLIVHISHEWLAGTFENLFSKLRFHFSINEQFELMAGDYLVYEKIE